MAKVTFNSHTYDCLASETILECLRRHGIAYPYSCQSGICQSCLTRSVSGAPPADAQKGLKPTQAAQNYFLACVCKPEQDMNIVQANAEENHVHTVNVVEKRLLSRDIAKLTLTCPQNYLYFPGQFLNLYMNNMLMRSYSLASLPQRGEPLELHIRKLTNGKISSWVHDKLSAGDEVAISDAKGDCFYTAGTPEKNLLLIGTGTGLAPLYGIARDALDKGHCGQIKLYHGSRNADGLYYIDELRALAAQHDNFHYISCVSGDTPHPEHRHGRANDVALQDQPNLKDWRVYLCGNPDMVNQSKKQVFLAGASFSEIYADAFLMSS